MLKFNNSFCLLLISSLLAFSQSKKQNLNWQVGYHNVNEMPTKWANSTVPGAVQLDIMVAEKYKQPYWYGNNFEQFTWMEQKYFTYKTTFAKPKTESGQRVFFHSKGIDYQFDIYLNGEKLLSQEGMFTYVDLDITSKLKESNEIKITLMPVPTVAGARQTIWHYRDNAAKSAKPAVSYGWDWHPRLITRGIWDETYLDVRESAFISNVNYDYDFTSPDFTTAIVKLQLDADNQSGNTYKWTLKDSKGNNVIVKEGQIGSNNNVITENIKNIELWWPNGYGNPTLYQSKVELFDKNKKVIDSKETKIGFRQIKVIMSEGGWIEPQAFPKSRSVAPANFEVNGKRIFVKGSNWVHPEIFMGLATKETYEKHVKLAKEANFNIFRVWGGGVTNKESFFDLCDQYGILVWQEFPLACNLYPDEPKYLSVLEQEARSIIKRVKQHASLALWCGGNELFNEWSGMTEQSMPLRLLNKLCYELDPKTPFIYTSPLFGMGHGHYVFWELKNGGEVFQWMPNAKNTAYTEYGVPGVANLEVLKAMMPANELFPPKLGTSWEWHHAFNVWGKNRWLEMPFLEEYFGEMKSLEDLVAYSQLSQCEGYKCIFEEARRQKPFCGMAINWCYQEPWPCAANNSLINWPSVPKAAYYHVAKSCRPMLASARIPKFRWEEGETFSCDLFLLNDSFEKLPASKVTAKLIYDDNKEISFLNWDFAGLDKENTNYAGPTARVPLPKMKKNLFKLVIEVVGKPELKSEYTLVYRGTDVQNAKPKIKYLNGVEE
ncbi:MAG: glycoside hydrolase family 2 TIM barrel-domain containing protein [Bacteroidota bacterium]|nr:glycoside hydrolase family 2 TIM barrel-domain containing protein [Bacteroidota bacterium]